MFFLLSLLFTFFFQPAKVFAIDDFSVDQKINYSVTQTGDANVSHEVTLTNNLSEIYPKEYQITLLGTNIKNITGSDTQGNVVQKTNQLDNNTLIFVKFNQASVGKGKTNKFILNYQLSDFASHKGSVWELPLPDFKNINDSDTISIKLKIPSTFGQLAYSSIPNIGLNTIGAESEIDLNQTNIKDKKALFIFGNYQLFDFDLKYFLNNPNSTQITTEIALPPDTASQKIVFKDISPQPQNIKVDSDGNWLAQYQLQPNEKINIDVQGQAKIFSKTDLKVGINTKDYLISQKYWPVDDASIKKISSSLNTPKDIYNYVLNTLSYNYDLSKAYRKGAIEALLDPQNSLCTEFTDVFVTLARSKNIPAREIEGYAYSNNPKIKPVSLTTDVLHAWPQYYDQNKQIWIDIDPTWAKTTNGIDYFNDLDLNHLTFVVHGKSSENPLPPGSYKNGRDIKTISVNFATIPLEETYLPPQVTTITPKTNPKPIISISNPNPNSINNVKISIPSTNWQYNLDFMPPYSSVQIEVPQLNFIQSILPQNQNIQFKIEYTNGAEPAYHKTPYMPHYLNLTITIGIIILVLSSIGIVFAFSKKKR